nr:hypothetical protein [Candidatus Sigynarchaeota archaeon]
MGKRLKLNAVEVLLIIGAIIGMILAIWGMFPGLDNGGWGIGLFWMLFWGIVDIILCFVILGTSGIVPGSRFKIGKNWIIILVVGIVIFAPTGNWGGLVVIIAAVVKMFV